MYLYKAFKGCCEAFALVAYRETLVNNLEAYQGEMNLH